MSTNSNSNQTQNIPSPAHVKATSYSNLMAATNDPFSASLSLEQDTFDRSLSLLRQGNSVSSINDSMDKIDSSRPSFNESSKQKGDPNPSILEKFNDKPINKPLYDRRGSKTFAEDYDQLMFS